MQGQAAKVKGSDAVKRGAVHIVKQLGLLGLYKGSTAWSVPCLFAAWYAKNDFGMTV